jgi:hypothetical protein
MMTVKKSDTEFRVREETLRGYLSTLYGDEVVLHNVRRLGSQEFEEHKDLKGFGYGFSYVIEFAVGDEVKRVVLETMRPEGFGHEYPSDRAGTSLAAFQHSPNCRATCAR